MPRLIEAEPQPQPEPVLGRTKFGTTVTFENLSDWKGVMRNEYNLMSFGERQAFTDGYASDKKPRVDLYTPRVPIDYVGMCAEDYARTTEKYRRWAGGAVGALTGATLGVAADIGFLVAGPGGLAALGLEATTKLVYAKGAYDSKNYTNAAILAGSVVPVIGNAVLGGGIGLVIGAEVAGARGYRVGLFKGIDSCPDEVNAHAKEITKNTPTVISPQPALRQ